MISATYSLILNNKIYSNHFSINVGRQSLSHQGASIPVGQSFGWIDATSYVTANTSDEIRMILGEQINQIYSIICAIANETKIVIENVDPLYKEFVIQCFSNCGIELSKKTMPTKLTDGSKLAERDDADKKLVQNLVFDAGDQKQKVTKVVLASVNGSSHPKSQLSSLLPSDGTKDAKKVLEIMQKVGNDKWPNFMKETHKRSCINYIRNNLNNKNITVADHIYKEIVDVLNANPEFIPKCWSDEE
jgi:hypothetical protein